MFGWIEHKRLAVETEISYTVYSKTSTGALVYTQGRQNGRKIVENHRQGAGQSYPVVDFIERCDIQGAEPDFWTPELGEAAVIARIEI